MINKIGTVIEKVIRFIFIKIFHSSLSDEKLAGIIQFIQFGLVGASNTILHYCIYLVCTLIGMQYMLANFAAFTISVLNSFYWNNRFVFKNEAGEQRSWVSTLIKTYISYGMTGLLLNSILLYIEVDLLGIHRLIAPIANLLITIPLNFIINKFWAFKTNMTK